MGHSAYVGRVGTLAVALGVGWAATVGAGVASAEPASASDSRSGSESSDASASATDAKVTAPPTTTGTSTTGSTSTSTSGSTSNNDASPSSTVSSSGGALTSDRATGAETKTVDPVDDPAPTPDPTPALTPAVPTVEATPPPVSTPTPTPSAPEIPVVERSDGSEGTTPTVESAPAKLAVAVSAAPERARVTPSTAASTATAKANPLAVAVVTQDATPAPSMSTIPAGPIETLLLAPTRIVVGLLGLLAGPLAGSPLNPISPAPVFELLIAFYRRIDNFLFNATPTANPRQTGQTSPGGIVSGSLNAVDPNGDPLTYTVTAQPTSGSVVVNADGTYVYTPRGGVEQAGVTDSFTVVIDDSAGFHLFGFLSQRQITTVVPVTVTGTNRAPVFGTPPRVTSVDPTTGAVILAAGATDPDGDTLTYTATAASGTATVTVDGSQITFRPTDDARHAAAANPVSDVVTVVATDRFGATATSTVTVSVLGANALPSTTGVTISSTNFTTGQISGNLNVTDADRDTLAYTPATVTTSKGTFTVDSSGRFTYTPTPDARHAAAKLGAGADVTTDTATFTVVDGFGGTLTVPVSVTIDKTNLAPIPLGSNVNLPDAAGVVTGTVEFTDSELDPITLTATAPAHGSVQLTTTGGAITTGEFIYTPTEAARVAAARGGPTTDTFTVTATDGYAFLAGTGASITITVAIEPAAVANRAPEVTVFASEPTKRGVVIVTITAKDPDGDPVTITPPESNSYRGILSLVSSTTDASGVTTATYRYTASDIDRATVANTGTPIFRQLDFTVSDEFGGSMPAIATVGVDGNRQPNATFDVSTTDGVARITVRASDPDGDVVAISGRGTLISTNYANGVTTSVYDYVPSPNTTSTNRFDNVFFTLTDGNGGLNSIPALVFVPGRYTPPPYVPPVYNPPGPSPTNVGPALTITNSGPLPSRIVKLYVTAKDNDGVTAIIDPKPTTGTLTRDFVERYGDGTELYAAYTYSPTQTTAGTEDLVFESVDRRGGFTRITTTVVIRAVTV